MRRSWRSGAAVLLLVLTGCADFSTEPPVATVQPSLSPAAMHPQEEQGFPLSTTQATPSSDSSASPSTPPEDPCLPADPTIIGACLNAPWGLAVLPDGASALVGERTTGRIMLVAPQSLPQEVARVDGVDSTGGGGLLGLVLSPHYVEDGLIYAFVTTAADNRIVRIALGDTPKPIFTGIPKGTAHNGGRIAFGADGDLYVATGDAGITAAGSDPSSLAGKVLRIDEFGTPVGSADAEPSNPLTAVFASGLVNPTGMCVLSNGSVGVIDRVGAADVLTEVAAGADIATGPALWRFAVIDGGGNDCAVNESVLGATSLDLKLVTTLTLGPGGGFTGTPETLVKDVYGRLLSLEPGLGGLLWATTSNRDPQGQPTLSDDLVVVIPTGGGSSGDGPD